MTWFRIDLLAELGEDKPTADQRKKLLQAIDAICAQDGVQLDREGTTEDKARFIIDEPSMPDGLVTLTRMYCEMLPAYLTCEEYISAKR